MAKQQSMKFLKINQMITGLGAAVVIAGAMFKINHWNGATLMLILGLSTEAVIFSISAFLPIHKEPDWTRVYPELRDEEEGEIVTEEESSLLEEKSGSE